MSGYDMVSVADIIYCEAVSNQTYFALQAKKKIIISMTLKECEELLMQYHFFRIHKSYLINLNQVKRYIKGRDGTGTVILKDDTEVTVSRGYREKFIELLAK